MLSYYCFLTKYKISFSIRSCEVESTSISSSNHFFARFFSQRNLCFQRLFVQRNLLFKWVFVRCYLLFLRLIWSFERKVKTAIVGIDGPRYSSTFKTSGSIENIVILEHLEFERARNAWRIESGISTKTTITNFITFFSFFFIKQFSVFGTVWCMMTFSTIWFDWRFLDCDVGLPGFWRKSLKLQLFLKQ